MAAMREDSLNHGYIYIYFRWVQLLLTIDHSLIFCTPEVLVSTTILDVKEARGLQLYIVHHIMSSFTLQYASHFNVMFCATER